MSRVIPALAIADLLVLIGASVLGLQIGGEDRYRQHFALALFGALLTLAIHVVVFTYFSVTGRMISQAVLIGDLDRTPLDRTKALKGRITRWLAVAVLSVIAVGAFGSLIESAYEWHFWHGISAGVAIALNGWAFGVEQDCVVRNGRLTDEVFAAYNAARAASSRAARPKPR